MSNKHSLTDKASSGDTKRQCLSLQYGSDDDFKQVLIRQLCALVKKFPYSQHVALQHRRRIAFSWLREFLAAPGVEWSSVSEVDCNLFDAISHPVFHLDVEVMSVLLEHGFYWRPTDDRIRSIFDNSGCQVYNFFRPITSLLIANGQDDTIRRILTFAINETLTRLKPGFEPLIRHLLPLIDGTQYTIYTGNLAASLHSDTVIFERLFLSDECTRASVRITVEMCQDDASYYDPLPSYDGVKFHVPYNKLVVWHLASAHPKHQLSLNGNASAVWEFLLMYAVSLVSGTVIRTSTYLGLLPDDVRRNLLARFVFSLCLGSGKTPGLVAKCICDANQVDMSVDNMFTLFFGLVSDGYLPAIHAPLWRKRPVNY
jgi:hypothetical protein